MSLFVCEFVCVCVDGRKMRRKTGDVISGDLGIIAESNIIVIEKDGGVSGAVCRTSHGIDGRASDMGACQARDSSRISHFAGKQKMEKEKERKRLFLVCESVRRLMNYHDTGRLVWLANGLS